METTTLPGRLLLEDYIASLQGQNLRPETISSRQRSLRSIDKAIGLLNAAPQTLGALGDIRGWSPGTRYAYGANAALFFAWAHSAGHVAEDPFAGVKRPRQPKYRPRPITRPQLEQLIDSLPWHIAAWATLAGFAGLRRAEIAQVRGADLVPTITGHELVIPNGKGGKADAVPAHERVVGLFDGVGPGHLFLTRSLRPYTPGHLGEVARAAFLKAGVNCTLHQLRHTFGTELYRHTRDVYMVKRAMRHDRLTSTEVYVAADTSWIAEAVCAL